VSKPEYGALWGLPSSGVGVAGCLSGSGYLDFGIRLGVVDVWSRCLFSYDNSNFIVFIKLYNFTRDIWVVTV
jgi:hypothetical protein